MNIQYISGFKDGQPISSIINIDISESATLGELLIKLHKAIDVPMRRKLKWGGHTTEVSCSHCIQFTKDQGMYEGIGDDDYNKKISEFPKNGPNGELVVYIDTNEGYVN